MNGLRIANPRYSTPPVCATNGRPNGAAVSQPRASTVPPCVNGAPVGIPSPLNGERVRVRGEHRRAWFRRVAETDRPAAGAPQRPSRGQLAIGDTAGAMNGVRIANPRYSRLPACASGGRPNGAAVFQPRTSAVPPWLNRVPEAIPSPLNGERVRVRGEQRRAWFRRVAETDRPAAGATHRRPPQRGGGISAQDKRSAALGKTARHFTSRSLPRSRNRSVCSVGGPRPPVAQNGILPYGRLAVGGPFGGVEGLRAVGW